VNKHVNLLHVQNDNDVRHFAWIKNLSRLVSSQLNKHNEKKYAISKYAINKSKVCLKIKNKK